MSKEMKATDWFNGKIYENGDVRMKQYLNTKKDKR